MAKPFVERADERKRVNNVYVSFRVQGERKWGFLKPEPRRGLVVSLGKGGMGVRVSAPVKEEAILDVQMELPGRREPLQFKAKVRWLREQRKLGTVTYTHVFGAQFIEYSPESWQALQEFLAE